MLVLLLILGEIPTKVRLEPNSYHLDKYSGVQKVATTVAELQQKADSAVVQERIASREIE